MFNLFRTAAVAAVLLAPAPALLLGAEFAGELTLDPAGVTRINSAVTVSMAGGVPEGNLILLPGISGGPATPVQVERTPAGATLRFVVHKLDGERPRTFAVFRDDPPAVPPAAWRFADGGGHRDLLFGDAPVSRDMIAYDPARIDETFKPFTHVYGFGRDPALITKGPGGRYTHHRGIFFGFNDTPHGDFWHGKGVSQRHARYLAEREFAGPVAARRAQVVDWVGRDEKAVIRDTREVITWRVGPAHVVMDYEVTVAALTDEPITLGGDAHHAGFHFRAAQEVADAPGADGKPGAAVYTRPAGATRVKDDVWEACDWTHAAFSVDGKPYAVTHLDPPANPRPNQYSTRPYGRFGSFFKGEVSKDKPLRLRYRLIIRDGSAPVPPEQLAAEYTDFITPVTANFKKQ